ncbi:MAG: EAL domain-containing protein [Mycobacteriales bacterium]
MTSDPARPLPQGLRAVIRKDEVRAALQSGQMVLHYLPIVQLATGRARGAEALIRWRHPGRGLLLPDEFLPAIAHTPVIGEITAWVLDTACRDLRRWPQWTVSVNVAARDVTDPALAALVADSLAAHSVDPSRLVLELTEHAVVSDLTLATDVLSRLRDVGVGLSLDDFGTGYSSLLYLRDLPLTEVKIDRAFVQRLITSPADAAIVQSVIRLGRSVGLHVVAEGVDSTAIADRLLALGCGSAQGFLWNPPLDAAEVATDVTHHWTPRRTRPRYSPADAPPEVPADVSTRIQQLLDAGASLHTIAAALNAEGHRTAHATRWHPSSVAQAITHLPPRAPEEGSSSS